MRAEVKSPRRRRPRDAQLGSVTLAEQRRILIDGFNLGLETGTGVATYARNLSYCTHGLGYITDILYGAHAAPGVDDLLHEIAFFDPLAGNPPLWLRTARAARDAVTSPFGAKAYRVPITGQVISTAFKSRLPYFDTIWNSPHIFGRTAKRLTITDDLFARHWRLRVNIPTPPDIAHWTFPLPMFVPKAKNIYTIHDLVPLRLPYTTLDHKGDFHRLVRTLARKADHIVTVSETSRKDIINLLGVPEDRVTNTYQSVEIPDKYANKPDHMIKREVEGAFNIKYNEYMLFYGAVEPKKNVGRLIEAYLASGIETPLLIVGKLGWKADQELRLLNDEIYQRNRIHRIDYVSFPLLVSLIKGAKAVLFPSLYEGFGLPILESMKLGTPVMTSTQGSMPEVAGEGALLVDPYDTRAMAEAIIALDRDGDLRASFSERGRRRAGEFSPDAHARRLKALYDRVLKPSL